jgi:predicted GNAT family acetyltransferase
MDTAVEATGSAQEVVDRAGAFLASEPVLHNLVRTLLAVRVAHPEPGRYWMVRDGDDIVGVVFQSPLDFGATMTPMPSAAARAAAAAIAASGVRLPGVHGDAATAACFAGHWTEHAGVAAVPTAGMRVYELHRVEAPALDGRLRVATTADRALVVEWVRAFQADVGEAPDADVEAVVDRRTSAGELWLWDLDGPVSMAGVSPPIDGVVRVAYVYTPPSRRGSGYASACVAALSARALAQGHRPMLYTDLGNPVSNSIYRRIGYRAVGECLRYRFD